MDVTTTLKQLINSNQLILAPGVFDGLSARLVEQAGFEVAYASGGAIARSSGFPDLGLLSADEVFTRLQQMVEVTNLPIIADADTGFGNEINVYRTFRHLERIGIAGAHIEDQQFPKRCGHLDNKSLIPSSEMVIKIKTARDALTDDNFLLIARTDAIAVEGFDQAIARAHEYLNAGADMIFVEAPQSIEQIQQIATQIQQPKLINMFYGGKTPLVPSNELQAMGYSVAIIPSDLQRAAIHAIQQTLDTIKHNGDSKQIAEQLTTFKEREQIIGTSDYLNLGKK